MRNYTHSLTLVAAVSVGGLALFLVGFFIAAEMRSADASPAAAVTGSGCYTNWNANTCSAGYAAVETGVWTVFYSVNASGGTICAAEKPADLNNTGYGAAAVVRPEDVGGPDAHEVDLEPCATCCAVTTGAVGGSIELFPGISDSPSHNYAVAAMLALVALVAFAAGGWYTRKRWMG